MLSIRSRDGGRKSNSYHLRRIGVYANHSRHRSHNVLAYSSGSFLEFTGELVYVRCRFNRLQLVVLNDNNLILADAGVSICPQRVRSRPRRILESFAGSIPRNAHGNRSSEVALSPVMQAVTWSYHIRTGSDASAHDYLKNSALHQPAESVSNRGVSATGC